MKINIYGVARSGTKFLQLYLAYLLSKKNGSAWIMYEPFYWRDRKLTEVNREGINLHKENPLIINDSEDMTGSLKAYLKKIALSHKHVVTKFIRANGRINAINEIMKPDISFIIIRDLYQVLSSIASKNWDMLSTQKYNDWLRLCAIAKNLYSDSPFNINSLNENSDDRMFRNALYWYVMNRIALENSKGVLFFIDYNNPQGINSILKKHDLFNSEISISDPIFLGDNIHSDFPLMDIHDPCQYPPKTMKIRDMLFSRFKKRSHDAFLSEKVGRLVTVYNDKNAIAPMVNLNTTAKTKVIVKRSDLLDALSDDIKKRLKKALDIQKQYI